MRTLHDALVRHSSGYAKWHSRPGHQVHHWVAFLAVAILMATTALTATQSLALSYEEVVSQQSPAPKKPTMKPETPTAAQPAHDRILIKFKDSVGQTKKAEVLAKHGFSELSEISQIGVKLVKIKDGMTPEEAVQNIKSNTEVDFAETDNLVPPLFTPNDTLFSGQWEKTVTNTPQAWDSTTGTPGMVIAIVDTGVDCTHPDLTCVAGWNFYDNSSDSRDVHGHGTLTAGTAAAIGNNAAGVAGQVLNAKIMPLRVSDAAGYAYDSTIAKAVSWAADHGAKVANNSYQTSDSSTVQSAGRYLKSKGGLLTVSEGNYSSDNGTAPSSDLISVSATDQNDTLYSWSSFGSDTDIAAPGCVTTTTRGGSYGGACGTSFSAPMTAGTLALIFSAKPSLTPDQAQSILFSTAKDLGAAGWDKYFGWGRIDAGAAVLAAIGSTSTADTLAPSVPGNLSTAILSSTQVKLFWSASSDNVGVTGYNVYRNGVKIGTSSTNSYTDSAAAANTTYSYQVSAFDAAGNASALSATVTAATPSPAISVTSYQVTAKTVNSATIVWTTNLPSTGSVSYGSGKNSLTLSATDGAVSTSHTVTLTGLSAFSNYYYKILATSQDGSSYANTNTSSFKTARK